MERPRGFFTKRSEHYNNIQKEENNKKNAIEHNLSVREPEKNHSQQEQSPSPKVENLDPNKSSHPKTPSKTALKCLETLAQKAGITFDEKYDNSLAMEKSQSPAQQQVNNNATTQQQMPLQISPEQYQQLQQFQLQQAFGAGATIQVKQEYANQQQSQGISAADLKSLQDQHNLQQMQIIQESPQSPHQNAAQNAQNAISLQQAVGQVPAEWQHGRVQVLQQPLQNASYLQQMYSPQLVMSGNILAHSGLGTQQQIQLITGKPFQNQLGPQMLTTAQGKPVLTSGGQTSYTNYTLPTIPSSQSQTLVFSPVGVISQQQNQQNQQNIMSSMQSQATPSKSDGQKQIAGQKVLQKVSQGNTNQQQTVTGTVANQQANNQQCVQVTQTMPTAQLLSGQNLQFASPWLQGAINPFWATTSGMQPQTLLATNPIFIRGTNPDGTPGMFIQQSPQQATQPTVQSPHQISLVGNITQTATQKVRPSNDGLAQKSQQQQQQPRAPPILPQGAQIRPASSVSTQTAMNQNLMAKTPKVRTKQTPVRPAGPNIKVSLSQQTGQPTIMQQVAPGVNKMVVMGSINGQLTPVLQQNNAQQILLNDKLKNQQQQQQQVNLQQAMANQQLANMQNAQQQQAIQQQIAQIQMQQQAMYQVSQTQAAQNAQFMAAQSGNLQQVVLQHPQSIPTVTVSSGVSIQQNMPTHMTQQGIMTKAGTHVLQMTQPTSTQSVSVPSSMANTQIVTSIAGTVTSDTSNSILGPLSPPQNPIQPPQNPLVAMTTLSASPMSSVGSLKEKSDASSGDSSSKITLNSSTTCSSPNVVNSSPLKRPATQDGTDKNATKKQTTDSDSKKSDGSSSPSVNKSTSSPGTPNSSIKVPTATNSPLASQNGESDAKKISTTANSNTSFLKNELPKAMVKPNVLTHVIEGYVIQESNEPFPVTRQRYSEKENDEPPKKKQAIEDSKANDNIKVNGDPSATTSNVTSSTANHSPNDIVACEHCGKAEVRSKLRRKRFCSPTCARANKSSSTDSPAVGNIADDNKNQIPQSPSQNDKSKTESSENGNDGQPIEEHIMLKWSVAQVCDFIKNLPGCSDYAEDFALQEIDGQALLLLKENHLVNAMGMKLGPALKIVNKIESMRVTQENDQNNADQQTAEQS